ncbi:MAG: hypothetical protein Kow0062_15130 [Acidobacteriota bacterium]
MTAHSLLRYVGRLKPSDIEELLVREHVIRRAEVYVEEGRVEEVWVDGDAVRAHVSGSSATPYHAVIRLHEGELEAECSCPYARGTCWHVGAMLMTLASDPQLVERLERQADREVRGSGPGPVVVPAAGAGDDEEPEGQGAREPSGGTSVPEQEREKLEERLLAIPKHHLARVLADLAVTDPVVSSRIATLAPDPVDLDLRLFRQAASAALRPGRHLGRFDVPRVAADVREVVRSVGRMLASGHPERGLELIQEIAWETWRRMEDADDRDGVLGSLVHEILLEWVKGWSEIEGRDRTQIARQLFAWLVEDAGAATSRLVVEARQALGPAGLTELRRLLEPALEERKARRATGEGGVDAFAHDDPVASRLASALREVAEALGDLDGFLALCRPDGGDGHAVLLAANRLVHEGRLEAALEWVTRGLPASAGSDRAALEDLRIKLLVHLDRRREAAEAAWQAFLREPGGASFRRLVESVGETTRADWRKRALEAVEAGADATALVDVIVAAEEAERLAHRLETAPEFVLSASSRSLGQAARLLARRYPEASARIETDLAERILRDGDSRRYDRVLEHLRRAQSLLETSGQAAAWNETLARLRRAHDVVRSWYPES